MLAAWVVLAASLVAVGVWVYLVVRAGQKRSEARVEPAGGVPEFSRPLDLGVTVERRAFIRAGFLGAFLLSLFDFAVASAAYLWPNLRGGFGGKIEAGSLKDILEQIKSSNQPFYHPEGRFYLVPYPGGQDPKDRYAREGVAAGGVMALYQRCPHLGCRVPFCVSSQWFECPCHGSKYNLAGEWQAGPAPRGMDRFPVTLQGDRVIVDTGTVVIGPPRGTDTIQQPPQGPHCVTIAT